MIEIEKNFDLRSGQRERLITGARLFGRKIITDSYYDLVDYSLTRRDYWLRRRDNRWELKVPYNAAAVGDRLTDRYHELETESGIIAALQLPAGQLLEQSLTAAGYKPFVTMVTTRESYQQGEFHLDFDEMDFGFTTFEAEIMVSDESAVVKVETKIKDFAKQYGLTSAHGRGKVIEYLYRYRSEHYQALVAAGVIVEP